MASREQSLQNVAAQTNLSGDNNTYNPELSHSQSINTIASIRPEYIISEDILAGQRMNGRMSNIRRFFCLFITFDLLFSSLMWIICIMLTGDNIRDALNKQVYHYNIETSLFDVVMIAVLRFTILLFFYACLYINHWIVIACSTSITCAFLLAKVFVYDWPASRQPVFEVLFVLVSFVLSWGEAWFLDFRVIPQETHARQFISVGIPDTERTPLIRSYVQGLPNNMSMYTESVGNFYSPMPSPEGSLHRINPPIVTGRFAPVRLTNEQENAYKMAAAQALQGSWDMLNSDNWKLEKENDCNDTVHTMMMEKTKVYKLTAVINLTPKYLLDELFFKVENIPSWNAALLESHKIQTIDENTDITYQISADGAAGIVASRDFVTLRNWDLLDGVYIIASVKTEHASLPKNDKYIRGENGVGCWAMRPLDGDCSKCVFQWVLNTNLNGWIPPFILNTAFVTMMFDYSKSLRKYTKKLTISSSLP